MARSEYPIGMKTADFHVSQYGGVSVTLSISHSPYVNLKLKYAKIAHVRIVRNKVKISTLFFTPAGRLSTINVMPTWAFCD